MTSKREQYDLLFAIVLLFVASCYLVGFNAQPLAYSTIGRGAFANLPTPTLTFRAMTASDVSYYLILGIGALVGIALGVALSAFLERLGKQVPLLPLAGITQGMCGAAVYSVSAGETNASMYAAVSIVWWCLSLSAVVSTLCAKVVYSRALYVNVLRVSRSESSYWGCLNVIAGLAVVCGNTVVAWNVCGSGYALLMGFVGLLLSMTVWSCALWSLRSCVLNAHSLA